MAIVSEDMLYTLRCTGCNARVELHRNVVRDPFLRMGRVEAMKQVHAACDSYHDVGAARRAIKTAKSELRGSA